MKKKQLEENKPYVWHIRIDDGYCSWQYEILSYNGSSSIERIMEAAANQTKGRIISRKEAPRIKGFIIMNPDKYYVNIDEEGYAVTKGGKIEARFVFKQNAEEYVKARNEELPIRTGDDLIATTKEVTDESQGWAPYDWYREQYLKMMAEKYPDAEQKSTPAGIEQTIKERGETHGDFSENAEIAQIIKNVFRGNAKDGWTNMPAEAREALDMIASKLCRILSGGYNYIDNWHDIQGYAALVEKYLYKAKQPYDDYPPPVTENNLYGHSL